MIALLLAAALVAPPPSVSLRAVALTVERIDILAEDAPEAELPRSLLLVRATARVGSSGWSRARLRQRGVDRDGYLDLDFLADPPVGAALDVMATVRGATLIDLGAVRGPVVGVRVRGTGDTVIECRVDGLGRTRDEADR